MVSAKPLLKRLDKSRGAKSAFARELGVEPAALTNWITRGVSYQALPGIAAALKITVDEYLTEAGVQAPPQPAKPDLRESGGVTSDSLKELAVHWPMLSPEVRAGILMIAKSAAAPIAAQAKTAIGRASVRKAEKAHH